MPSILQMKEGEREGGGENERKGEREEGESS